MAALAAEAAAAGDPRPALEVRPLDLASLASVRSFAAAWEGAPLDILVCNAGVFTMVGARSESADGVEAHAAANHVGHFLLTLLLLPCLKTTGTQVWVRVWRLEWAGCGWVWLEGWALSAEMVGAGWPRAAPAARPRAAPRLKGTCPIPRPHFPNTTPPIALVRPVRRALCTCLLPCTAPPRARAWRGTPSAGNTTPPPWPTACPSWPRRARFGGVGGGAA